LVVFRIWRWLPALLGTDALVFVRSGVAGVEGDVGGSADGFTASGNGAGGLAEGGVAVGGVAVGGFAAGGVGVGEVAGGTLAGATLAGARLAGATLAGATLSGGSMAVGDGAVSRDTICFSGAGTSFFAPAVTTLSGNVGRGGSSFCMFGRRSGNVG